MNPINDRHYVNWTDGMKLNKNIFLAQDNANLSRMYHLAATNTSNIRYGLLPLQHNYQTNISVDNQNVVTIQVVSCKAITQGGVLIDIDANNPVTAQLPVSVPSEDIAYQIILLAKPYDRLPFGEVDVLETPARLPFVKFDTAIVLADPHQLRQYMEHPLALSIGKLYGNGSALRNDDEYIPPCISVDALEDLQGLMAELDAFLSTLELSCSQIVQKIYRKSQQNNLSELAQFLCDRIMLYLGDIITRFRTTIIHEPPAVMFACIAALARIIKNTIDLRIGSGKDELMNYLCEWCELNQGELEALLTQVSIAPYKHYDINENVAGIVHFAKVMGKLFATLSNLEFIGKRKESGLFVKEETPYQSQSGNQPKPKRRFFG